MFEEEEDVAVRAWYSVQTYSGMENVVKKNIERRIESMGMSDRIFNVLVPEEITYEKKKNGELREIREKPFAGYVFIDMIVDDNTWFMVRNTPMVTGFLGSSGGGAKPVPIPEEEMIPILKMCGAYAEKPFECEIGDKVQIKDPNGAFDGEIGVIDTIDNEKKIVRVLLEYFGRPTPVECQFDQIEKL